MLVIERSIAFRLLAILMSMPMVSMTLVRVSMVMAMIMPVSMPVVMAMAMVVVMVTSRVENLMHSKVNTQANGGSDHHNASVHVNGVYEPVDGLVDQPYC